MKIYIISLKNSNRRDYIDSIFKKKSISYNFFDAVDGRLCKQDRYNREKRLLIKGRDLTAGENGCFASHRKLWELCVEENSPILVLEDDVMFSNDFWHILNSLKNLVSRYEYIRLGRCSLRNFLGKKYSTIDDEVMRTFIILCQPELG